MRRRHLAVVLFALVLSVFAAGVGSYSYLYVVEPSARAEALGQMLFATANFSFPAVGLVIARRQPRNAVGWLLLADGLAWQLDSATVAYGIFGLSRGVPLPAPELVLVISSCMWVPGVGLLGAFLLLLFPDGHLPSRRWRPVAWLAGSAMLCAFTAILFSPGPVEIGIPGVENPIGVEAMGQLQWLLGVVVALIPLSIFLSAIAMVSRFRRSRGVERLQLKWFAAAAGGVAFTYTVAIVVSIWYPWESAAENPLWADLILNGSLFAMVLLPVAAAVAILRHRLYDIDHIINRALVYAGVTGCLALVYTAGVVGASATLRSISGQEQNNLAVAASTLAVAALFRPLRSAVQRIVDRRFYRSRYDARRTVESFSAQLRHETDLARLVNELNAAISSTLRPRDVAVWIANTPGGGRAADQLRG